MKSQMIRVFIGLLLAGLISTQFIPPASAHHQTPGATQFIPEHTPADLWAVRKWSVGLAYASFASLAKVRFDSRQHIANCPNPILFNFGFATGMEYLHFDVAQDLINANFYLSYLYRKSPENFQALYLQAIRKTEFKKYLIRKTNAQ